jgi:hypothetical protein
MMKWCSSNLPIASFNLTLFNHAASVAACKKAVQAQDEEDTATVFYSRLQGISASDFPSAHAL